MYPQKIYHKLMVSGYTIIIIICPVSLVSKLDRWTLMGIGLYGKSCEHFVHLVMTKSCTHIVIVAIDTIVQITILSFHL